MARRDADLHTRDARAPQHKHLVRGGLLFINVIFNTFPMARVRKMKVSPANIALHPQKNLLDKEERLIHPSVKMRGFSPRVTLYLTSPTLIAKLKV
jgi:hypothetical protein